MTKETHRPENCEKTMLRAMMHLAAERGWANASLFEAALSANVAPQEARQRFPNKNRVLIALGQYADGLALSSHSAGSPREQLFDLLMRRLDAFQEYREGVRAVMRAIPFDPMLGLMLATMTESSMGWIAGAAGVDMSGISGRIRLNLLVAMWAYVMRVWDQDSSEDLAITMSALDKALDRAARLGLLRSALPTVDTSEPASTL